MLHNQPKITSTTTKTHIAWTKSPLQSSSKKPPFSPSPPKSQKKSQKTDGSVVAYMYLALLQEADHQNLTPIIRVPPASSRREKGFGESKGDDEHELAWTEQSKVSSFCYEALAPDEWGQGPTCPLCPSCPGWTATRTKQPRKTTIGG
jgi:hypothetical protein